MRRWSRRRLAGMKGSDRGRISGATPAPWDARQGAPRRTMQEASATSRDAAVRPGRGVPLSTSWGLPLGRASSLSALGHVPSSTPASGLLEPAPAQGATRREPSPGQTPRCEARRGGRCGAIVNEPQQSRWPPTPCARMGCPWAGRLLWRRSSPCSRHDIVAPSRIHPGPGSNAPRAPDGPQPQAVALATRPTGVSQQPAKRNHSLASGSSASYFAGRPSYHLRALRSFHSRLPFWMRTAAESLWSWA